MFFFSQRPMSLFSQEFEVLHSGAMMARVLAPGYILLVFCQIFHRHSARLRTYICYNDSVGRKPLRSSHHLAGRSVAVVSFTVHAVSQLSRHLGYHHRMYFAVITASASCRISGERMHWKIKILAAVFTAAIFL